jgi:hypothetical protein
MIQLARCRVRRPEMNGRFSWLPRRARSSPGSTNPAPMPVRGRRLYRRTSHPSHRGGPSWPGYDAAGGRLLSLKPCCALRRVVGLSNPRASARGTEDDVSQALSPGCRLALAGKLGPPCGAKVVTYGCGLRQRRVGVQSLKTAIHLDVHTVLIGALPDVRFGVLFFVPSTPAAESTTHRTERRLTLADDVGLRRVLRGLLALFVHSSQSTGDGRWARHGVKCSRRKSSRPVHAVKAAALRANGRIRRPAIASSYKTNCAVTARLSLERLTREQLWWPNVMSFEGVLSCKTTPLRVRHFSLSWRCSDDANVGNRRAARSAHWPGNR